MPEAQICVNCFGILLRDGKIRGWYCCYQFESAMKNYNFKMAWDMNHC